MFSPRHECICWLLQAIHLLTWLQCPRSRGPCRASWLTITCFPGWKHSPAFNISARPLLLQLPCLPPAARILPGVWYHLDSSYLWDRDLLINSGSLCWDRAQNTGGGGGCLSVCLAGQGDFTAGQLAFFSPRHFSGCHSELRIFLHWVITVE